MPDQTLILGVDGGGSKTLALLAGADGTLMARGVAGASNYNVIGAEAAFAAIDAAVLAALSDRSATEGAIAAVCIGMAGVDRPGDRALFGEWASARWPGRPVAIVNDADLVLAAGTPAGWGLGMICGTGSIVYGRDASGRKARAGGWGYLLGDEGSGYAIGLAALRAIARADDGRAAPTALTNALLAHWSLAAPQELIRRIYVDRASTSEIAGLAALVDDVAAAGDTVAGAIIDDAARELALALGAVAHRLALGGPLPCALAGGLIANRAPFRLRVLAAATRAGLVLDPVAVVAEPALGAITIAASLIRQSLRDAAS
jgi:N-acetylmuramic acid 6-phosphate etherase